MKVYCHYLNSHRFQSSVSVIYNDYGNDASIHLSYLTMHFRDAVRLNHMAEKYHQCSGEEPGWDTSTTGILQPSSTLTKTPQIPHKQSHMHMQAITYYVVPVKSGHTCF